MKVGIWNVSAMKQIMRKIKGIYQKCIKAKLMPWDVRASRGVIYHP